MRIHALRLLVLGAVAAGFVTMSPLTAEPAAPDLAPVPAGPGRAVQRLTQRPVEEVAITAAEVVPALGLTASACEFEFERPVYSKTTFTICDTNFSKPDVYESKSPLHSRKFRLAYTFVHPQRVAAALGLTVQGTPKSKYSFTLTDLQSLGKAGSRFGAENVDPLANSDGWAGLGGISMKYTGVPLNEDFVVYSMTALQPGEIEPQSVEDFTKFKRYLLLTIRFSAEPFD